VTWPRAIFIVFILWYMVLGLAILSPDAVYSGDIGVKFVQARALVMHRFTSLDLPYPGAFLDPEREFFPMRPPFVMSVGGETQTIYTPASAVLAALGVGPGGIRGLVLITVVSGALALFAAWKIAPARDAVLALVALGLAGPLWFYAVSGWEHAPAVALGAGAFAFAIRGRSRLAPVVAGLLLGAGATLRDELLLLLPGLLLVMWLRERALRPVLVTGAAVAVLLVAAAAMDVWWFHRPAAAHLRHAVHFLRRPFSITADATELPSLRPLTLRQRYEFVVQYWLLGYGNDRVIAIFSAGLALALLVRWFWRSSILMFIWLVAIVVLAAIDLRELVTAPKWLAGLQRVSPYFVFALFPAPPGTERRGWLPAALLFASVCYFVLTFVGADTNGGKSLGPRLLLPVFPLLAVGAAGRIRDYVGAPRLSDRLVGWTGCTLLVMSIAMHLAGTVPAYVVRNHGDSGAIQTIAASSDRIVVADDPFTAQLLFPLYFRKTILLADSPQLGERLGARLMDAHVAGAMLVSRRGQPAVTLPPYRLDRTEVKGRAVIQYWLRY
jgi:hypothetical protein